MENDCIPYKNNKEKVKKWWCFKCGALMFEVIETEGVIRNTKVRMKIKCRKCGIFNKISI